MTANLTTRLGQLVDVLTPDTTNTRIGVANASPTRTLDVTGTGAISTSLAIGGATIGTNALAVTGTTALSSTLNFGGYAAEGTVTAAATTDLGTSTANRQSVTGNTTITSFGTGANLYRIIRFTGTPLITYNATSLITPTGANIQASPGDYATLSSDASGNWTITSYQPFGGVKSASVGTTNFGSGSAATLTSIALTPGKWLLSGTFVSNFGALSVYQLGIGPNNNSLTGTTMGISQIQQPAGTNGSGSASIPPFPITITSNTTYYLVAQVTDSNPVTLGASMTARRIY